MTFTQETPFLSGEHRTALIALGANLPWNDAPPEATLAEALVVIAQGPLGLRAVSRFYRTPCFPAGAGPDYVNAAILCDVPDGLEARDVLAELHRIETHFGRARAQRWGMRTLDLDLVAMDGAVAPDEHTWRQWHDLPAAEQRRVAPDELILPHPRLQDRGFVLVPLADVAPAWRHPILGRTIFEMRAALPREACDEIAPM